MPPPAPRLWRRVSGVLRDTATNPIGDIVQNPICDKPYNATNPISDKPFKATNPICDKPHKATNPIRTTL